MFAYQTELEPHGALGLSGDVACGRMERSRAQVIFVCVAKQEGLFDAFGRVGDSQKVFLPGDGWTAIVAEELVSVGRIMSEPEFVVGFGEVLWFEVFLVRLAVTLDVPRAPARVDKFPFAVVDAHHVPGVIAFERREC